MMKPNPGKPKAGNAWALSRPGKIACALSRPKGDSPPCCSRPMLNRLTPSGGTGGSGGGRNSGGPKAHGQVPPVMALICQSGMPAHQGHGEPVGRPHIPQPPPHQGWWRMCMSPPRKSRPASDDVSPWLHGDMDMPSHVPEAHG